MALISEYLLFAKLPKWGAWALLLEGGVNGDGMSIHRRQRRTDIDPD